MSHASRRRARRLKNARVERAEARIAERRQQIADGTRKGPRVATRKDRQDRSSRGGFKQQYKHMAARGARRRARDEVRRAALLELLNSATAQGPARLTRLDFLGGCVPMTGEGQVALVDGTILSWTFRFRYDRAFLEVGTLDEWGLVDECALAASWDDVTGEPYEGWLDDAQAVAVLTKLFLELMPPAGGSRFGERLANTLDLSLGRGGDPQAPTLIRMIPAS